ncbi:MAG TPA: SDR family oxidoreductase [Steroidobacteraceae bacterium]|nr:SDR family oxidoreductase [Steroidobacteraceae bacterium]
MELNGKVVVVTGGARGIGKAIATAFVDRGSHVALLDLNPADLEATRAEFAGRGVTVSAHTLNVAKEDEVVRAFDEVVAQHGRLDVLVNNAGIIRDALLVKVKDGAVVGKMSLAQWQAVIDVNLTGVFLCGREGAERMIRLGNGGAIINISSISRAGNAGQSNYSAAKAAVTAMAVTWARELARFGVRAAAIAPGFIKTDLLAGMPPEMLEKMTAPVPLKRLGLPGEIAHTAVYIAENDFFTGRCVDVDGGLRL